MQLAKTFLLKTFLNKQKKYQIKNKTLNFSSVDKLVATKYKHNKLNNMTIDWYVGKRCNFCCSYCADFIHDNHSNHVPFEKMKIFVDKIVANYGTNINWSLTGGEPTLNPDFLKLLQYLQDKKYEISVCTNGSRSIDYIYQMYEWVDNITFSLHFEHISLRLDEYIKKAIDMENWRLKWNRNIPREKKGYDIGQIQPKQLLLRFMVLPGFGKEIERLTQELSPLIEKIEHRVIRPQKENFLKQNKTRTKMGAYKWKMKPKALPINKYTKVSPDQSNLSKPTEIFERERRWYSEKDREILENLYRNTNPKRKWLIGFTEQSDGKIIQKEYHYNDLNYQNQTSFKGWTCYAGVSLLKIAPNGDIFIANCFQGGSLGNIYSIDDNFQPPTQPVICQKLRCTDPVDLRQSKYISKKYKKLVKN